jgi:hypothetical protein
MEIARRTIPPSFALTPEVAGTASLSLVNAGQYFEAVAAHGSPAYSVDELTSAPEGGRHWADVVLSKALPLSTAARPGGPLPGNPARCTTLPGGAGEATPELRLRPGLNRIWLARGAEVDLFLRRFAVDEYPVELGTIPGGSVTLLRVPRDKAPQQPWYLRVEAAQALQLCG